MNHLRAACTAAGFATLAIAPVTRADDSADAPAPEVAATPPDSAAKLGFQVGLRVAYTDGVGIVYEGIHLSDASSGALPLMVDLGWRFLPQLYVGAYGQFAPVFLKTYALTCPPGFTCAGQDWRLGVEADYHFLPRSKLDPYVGLGVGYEILHSTFRDAEYPYVYNGSFVLAKWYESIIARGWEFASLTLGFDWRFTDMIGAGLFVLGTVGEYGVQTGNYTVMAAGAQQTTPVPAVQIGAHELAFIGLRGTFNP
ncbi:MAG: hypothetical protein ABSC94_13330 [Polyangiaceae bacterium]